MRASGSACCRRKPARPCWEGAWSPRSPLPPAAFCMAWLSSKTIKATVTKYGADYMARNNVGRHWSLADRARISRRLREIGHRPKTRGGNGKPIPVPQRMLADALRWPTEVVVKTGTLPHCYKIDVADEETKTAVEVDGGSHGSAARREQDRRKDKILAGLGWTVLRFSNRRVMERLGECVREVLSTTSR